MTVVIIDYNSGNLRSALKAFEYSSAEIVNGPKVIVSRNPKDLHKASHIVLPGVGAYRDCRQGLSAIPGMDEGLQTHVIEFGKPFLGICVGMQLLASRGFENGMTEGLNWIAGNVVPLSTFGNTLKVPHMGWNNISFLKNRHPIFNGLKENSHAYFVHSFHLQCEDNNQQYAVVNYGTEIAAVVGKNNILGTQFHPEKSQSFGLRFISNFLQWTP